MTQIIELRNRAKSDNVILDCPQCGATAEIGKEQTQGIMIICPICGFMVASVIDTEFAVTAWNDLSKRGRI